MRFERLTLAWIIVGLLFAAAPRQVYAGMFYDKPATLSELMAEALARNEAIRSMEFEVAALEEQAPAAGALDDPRLLVGVANLPVDTFDFNQEPMTQKQIFLLQKIPWFGKLALQEQKAFLAALKQAAALEAMRLELLRSVAEAYYELGLVKESLRVNSELTQLVTQMLRVAEAGYASGLKPQQDVFMAQVELGKLMDEAIILKRRNRTLIDRLNELLTREAAMPVVPPERPPIPSVDFEAESVIEQVLNSNPQLKAKRLDIESAKVDLELARKAYYPDMDFRVGYGQRDEDLTGRSLPDFFSASVTVNLPLWQRTKQDKLFDAAASRHKAAVLAFDNLRKTLPHRVRSILTEIKALRENHRLFEDALLLQTDQWSRASLAAYEVGKVDFDTMISAQIRRMRFELQTIGYRYTLYKKLAELEALAGEAAGDKQGEES